MTNGYEHEEFKGMILRQITKQVAQMIRYNCTEDPSQVKWLEKFKAEALRNGCSKRAITLAIKKGTEYDKYTYVSLNGGK